MSLKTAFQIAAAGLMAQRTRMETVASNLANARTTRTPEGGPYRRIAPLFVSEPIRDGLDLIGPALHGVRVDSIVEDPAPPILRFEPGHPDADAAGFVAYPDVDPVKEMVDMLSASRSYEANITVISSLRSMFRATLDIIS